MQPARSPVSGIPAEFADGLGIRLRLAEKAGEELEVLRLAPEFVAVPAFEFALRERVSRLANFRHAYYARVRRVDRLDNGAALGLVSEHATGARLSHVLAVAEHHKLDLDINAALCLVRQLVPAIGMLHENARDVAHGALAPERTLVTSHARILITDYVLGSAIEQLRLSRERLWRDLRIAVPPGAGHPRLDHRADVMQIGIVALSLVLGRRLHDDELRSLPALVASATETTVLGDRAPISAPLRRWLLRTLQAEGRGSFESAADAQQGLEDVLSGEAGYIAAPVALETFLGRYHDCARRDLAEAEASAAARPASDASPNIETERPRPAVPGRASDREDRERRHAPDLVQTRATPAPAPRTPAAEPSPVFERSPSGRHRAAAAASTPSHADPPAEPVPPGAAPSIVQPFADAPQPTPPASTSPRSSGRHRAATTAAAAAAQTPAAPGPAAQTASGPSPDAVSAAQHQLSREIAAAHVAEHMFGLGERQADTAAAPADPDPLPRPSAWRRFEHTVLVLAVALALGEAAFIRWALLRDDSLRGGMGALTVESRPTGVPVIVDGESRGTTPLQLRLHEGAHVLELKAPDRSRVLPVTIRSGETLAQYLELPSVDITGTLEVRESPGARVLVDGQLRGTSPVKISDLTPGVHEVVIDGRGMRGREMIDVKPGVTTTLGGPAGLGGPSGASAPDRPPASGDGWVHVETPYEMQVYEAGRLLGTTSADRLALPAGPHTIEIVSETLAFRTTRSLTVTVGAVQTVAIDLPKGTLVLESDPPADVSIDGTKVGTTPIARLPVTIGPHEITFSHPELGQQHQAVSVTAGAPVRVSVKLAPQQ